MAGDEWRCRKHPAQSCGGVCPYCLRDRLLRLCPDCARTRPCPCASSSPSSSSSASGSAVARVYSLIEQERRMGRSRSVAAGAGAVAGGSVGDGRRRSKVFGWVSFRRATSDRGVVEDEGMSLARSSSVSATAVEARAASRARGWGRFIPGSIRALRHRKSRSGDCRETRVSGDFAGA